MGRTATFTFDELDLRRAVRLHAFSWIRERRTVIRLSILWIIAMAVFVRYLDESGTPWPELGGRLLVGALIVTATIFGGALGLPLVLSPFIIRRRFRQEKLLRQSITASWDESAYEVDQPGAHNHIPWRDYMRRREDRHLFVFFLSDYTYQVLPKRALTQEQILDIQRILSAL